MQSQREGDGVEALGEPTESKYAGAEKEGRKERRTREMRRERIYLVSALSAVNGEHVADDLLSQGTTLTTLTTLHAETRQIDGSTPSRLSRGLPGGSCWSLEDRYGTAFSCDFFLR